MLVKIVVNNSNRNIGFKAKNALPSQIQLILTSLLRLVVICYFRLGA